METLRVVWSLGDSTLPTPLVTVVQLKDGEGKQHNRKEREKFICHCIFLRKEYPIRQLYDALV